MNPRIVLLAAIATGGLALLLMGNKKKEPIPEPVEIIDPIMAITGSKSRIDNDKIVAEILSSAELDKKIKKAVAKANKTDRVEIPAIEPEEPINQ